MPGNSPTFWVYINELFGDLIPADKDTLERLKSLLQDFSKGPIASKHESWKNVFELLSSFPEAPEIAIQVGRRIPTTSFIPMAVPIRLAPTIREMLRFVSRYYRIQAPLIDVTFIEEPTKSRIDIKFRLPVSGSVENFAATAAFSIADMEISHITGKERNFSAACLRHCSPEYSKIIQSYFGITPDKNCTENAIFLSDEILDKRNPLADPLTFRKYSTEYEEQLKRSKLTLPKKHQVREILMAQISSPPSPQQIADALKLSERQLRFALSKEGSNYREILQECRIETATYLLKNSGLNISQIAFKLGYNDLAAFNHGFKRWTGKSPSAFQKELRAKKNSS